MTKYQTGRQPGDPLFDGAEEFFATAPDDVKLCARLRQWYRYDAHPVFRNAADRIEQLNADVARLRPDAARYLYIRRGEKGTYNRILIHAGSALDAAIDAAISEVGSRYGTNIDRFYDK